MSFKRIVVLTGAGVSAESGMGTFRDKDGIWTRHSLEDVATPEGFARNPRLVHDFYNARRRALRDAIPNTAHFALAKLEKAIKSSGGDLMLVTQNVDDLHERAGARRLIHMHGELLSGWCLACDGRNPWSGPMPVRADCPQCGAQAVRPDIVFFGEMPYRMDAIEAAIARADLFVSIGTSGAVYPAAGFVRSARWHGARTLELNLEPSEGSHFFDESRMGPAGQLVPAWVDEMLATADPAPGEAQS